MNSLIYIPRCKSMVDGEVWGFVAGGSSPFIWTIGKLTFIVSNTPTNSGSKQYLNLQYWCSMVSISAFQADGTGSSPVYCSNMSC